MRMLRFAILLFTPGFLSPASAQTSAADIIADHIRSQGYVCDSPLSAKRDAHASKPDEQVWALSCAKGRYRVRLVPDMAAVVEKIQ